ncbi:C3a anaphylatoxin chemotactic receptor [Rhineura floridana]|uniref:C3a anaphylatoxin chemotactic receptor n=1 Tax=Rhineura floridana TaxID=261503 RepID=UPI002AC81D74|nr:C3a anaphylatoxin chemotactic receptor [Rhineura floridana]
MPPFLANYSLYQSDDSFMLHHTPISISSLTIFSITFLLGLPGNGLVIWVVALKMKRTVNTIWFLHLAVADFVCCLSLPFSIVHLALHEQWPYGWFFCKIIPSTIIFNMFASVFLLTIISVDRCLVVMKPVWCQNHRTARFASLICGGIWLLAFIMCCPAFFYREISTDEFGNTRCVYNWHGEEYGDKWPDDPFPSNDVFSFQHPPLTASGYEDISTDGILGILDMHSVYHIDNTTNKTKALHSSTPSSLGTDTDTSMIITDPTSIVLTSPRTQLNTARSSILHSDGPAYFPPGSYSGNLSGSNSSMEMYFYGHFPEIQLPSALVSITVTRSIFGFLLPFGIMAACYALIAHKMLTNQFANSRRKALRVILLVVATFFLCWAPYHVIGVLFLLANPNTAFYETLTLWDHVSTALAYANSCINPLLYVFVGQSFREKACQTVQGIFERAFSEEGTCSTAYSQDRSKATIDDIDVSVL